MEKKGTAKDPNHTDSYVKHGGGGVMAWACMTVSGTTLLMTSCMIRTSRGRARG